MGFANLHNNGRTDIPDKKGFTDDWKDVQKRVDGIDPGHATPITRRYYEVVKNFVMPNIKYRCQKSYVIVMSDGDANMSCSNQSYGEDPSKSRNTNFNYDRDYYYSNYYRAIEHSADTPCIPNISVRLRQRLMENNHKQGEKFGYFYLPIYDPRSNTLEGEKKFQCQYAEYAKNASGNWVLLGEKMVNEKSKALATPLFLIGIGTIRMKNAVCVSSARLWQKKDIKTEKDGKDDAGKSWDGDPSDPKGVDYSKQLVQTFTVGFGEGISEVGREYLEKGASRPDWYFKAEKKEDLLEAFKTIVDNIENDSKNTKFEGASSTAPATTSTGIPNMAATVHLNTGSWSSQLRFYKLKRDGTPINTTEFVLPSFNNRLTFG